MPQPLARGLELLALAPTFLPLLARQSERLRMRRKSAG
jgi:hypothetical protein